MVSRRSRRTRPRPPWWRPPSRCSATSRSRWRADFFADLGGTLAACRPLRLGGARDAGARRHHPAGRLRQAHDARDGGRPDRADGGRRLRGRRAGPKLRAAAVAPPGPVRAGAGRGAAHRDRARHGAVARHLRDLPAPDRRGPELLRRARRAAPRLYRDQRPYGSRRGDRQMAGARADQARPLSPLGRLLLPLVACAAPRAPGPREVASGLAGHRHLPAPDGRQGRQGRPHLGYRDRRAGSSHHRRWRLPWGTAGHRQCRDRRQRAGHRPRRDRRGCQHRHILRRLARYGDRGPGRDRRPDHRPHRLTGRRAGTVGRLAGPQGRHGRPLRPAGALGGEPAAAGGLPARLHPDAGCDPGGRAAADLPGPSSSSTRSQIRCPTSRTSTTISTCRSSLGPPPC